MLNNILEFDSGYITVDFEKMEFWFRNDMIQRKIILIENEIHCIFPKETFGYMVFEANKKEITTAYKKYLFDKEMKNILSE